MNRSRMNFLLFVISFAGAMSPFVEADTQLPVPEIETLSNGLQVAWFLNDKLPVVDIALTIKSGYRDDQAGKSGTAALLSAVLDRGAAGMSAQQIAHSIEVLGASRYLSAEDDTFNAGVHGLAPDATTLIDLLSKIVLHPNFDSVEVKREHERLVDRWKHLGDYSESLATLTYQRVLAAGSSYGRGSFLSVGEFNHVTRDDLMTYYKRNFTPKNAVLMIVGRVNQPEFRKLVEDKFGNPEVWQGNAPARNWKPFADRRLPKPSKGSVIVVDRPDLTQAQIQIGFKAPLIQSPDHYSLVVANALLGEYFDSRLNSLIRDQLGLTYSIASSFSYSRDFASLTISTATRTESTGELIAKTFDVLRGMKKGPIPDTEVRMAKEYLIGGFPLQTSTLGAVASRWLAGFVFDLGPNYLNEYGPKVNAIQAKDVARVVAKDFDIDHAVVVIAGNAKEIEKSLKAAKIHVIKRVTLQELM